MVASRNGWIAPRRATRSRKGCGMRWPILGLIGLALLSGCATAVSDVCPTLYSYSPEMQGQAADELEALPAGSALAVMIGHYGVVRNEIRACRGTGWMQNGGG